MYDYYALGHTLGAPRPRRGRGCLGSAMLCGRAVPTAARRTHARRAPRTRPGCPQRLTRRGPPGTGGYAVVKLGTQKQTGRKVAIKIMRLPEGGTLRGMYAMHQAKARARCAQRAP